jgi:SP family general alpha glucoside:H+ symporter-like MFS transporter
MPTRSILIVAVPEPSGRSFAELDLLFERKVSARKFASTTCDVFDDSASYRSEAAVSTYEAKGHAGVTEKAAPYN